MKKEVRVRYAPSPTGHLHIGNARTALFNYLYARKNKGKFIVRIEDTDIERNIETGIESQLDNLKWLGIEWDESIDTNSDFGPYRQLERLDIYKKYADILLEKGIAYKCYCTPEELELEREKLRSLGESNLHYSEKCKNLGELDKPYTIRVSVPEGKEYVFNDIVKGKVSFQSKDIGDWVIVKNNGIPTYNFACVIDDHLMEISHVLRGEDHLTNTPKQMMIYDFFGWNVPIFGHMTLICNENGKKLSKRDESIIQFIEQYRELGYLPEGLFNFIALLGWSPEGKKEIFNKEKLISIFDDKRLSKSPATFDKNKLAHVNNRHIKLIADEKFVELAKKFFATVDIDTNSEQFYGICKLFKDRVNCVSEVVELYNEFFNTAFKLTNDHDEFLKKEGVKSLLSTFCKKLENSEWNTESIKECMNEAGEETGLKGKDLFMPCRISTTGQLHGPDLPLALSLLNKDEIVRRVNETIDYLK